MSTTDLDVEFETAALFAKRVVYIHALHERRRERMQAVKAADLARLAIGALPRGSGRLARVQATANRYAAKAAAVSARIAVDDAVRALNGWETEAFPRFSRRYIKDGRYARSLRNYTDDLKNIPHDGMLRFDDKRRPDRDGEFDRHGVNIGHAVYL